MIKKSAFTLAEVLITLGIIGVVATMTVPTLMANQNAKVFKERKAIAELKIREITRQMNFDDMLAPHYTTASFIEALKQYVKIGQACDSNNLTDCFAEQITKSTGEIVEVKDLKNSSKLGKTYSDLNQAFSMMDGLTFIMTYDNTCVAPDKYNSTLSTTECLSYILDVNGKKGPNKIGDDIVLVNTSLPGGGCDGIEFDDLCIATEDIEYLCENNGTCSAGEPCDCSLAANTACQAIGMRAPNAFESMEIFLHREELGNPANIVEGFNPEMTEENVNGTMQEYETLPDAERSEMNAYLTFMMYHYAYNGVWSDGVSYNKIRCVK